MAAKHVPARSASLYVPGHVLEEDGIELGAERPAGCALASNPPGKGFAGRFHRTSFATRATATENPTACRPYGRQRALILLFMSSAGPSAETADAEHSAPWREPTRGRYPDASLSRLAGIDLLRTLVQDESRKPPIGHLVGMALTEVGLGTATFSMPATGWLLSPHGLISGGTLAILADGPLGCAVHSALPAGTGYVTSELSLRMLRPTRAGGNLIARARLVHGGRSLALSSGQIVDERGRLIADGSSLCLLREGAVPPTPPPRAGAPATASPDPFERDVLGDVLPQEVWGRMSGLEVLEAQLAGDLPPPPLHFLTGLRLLEAGAGRAVFALPCHEWLCSPLGTVEGGTIAMVADAALASAVQTTAPAGSALVAIDLKVNFLRPVQPDGREIVAHGRIRHAGRTMGVAEAKVVNADGKPVALATGSAMVVADRPADLLDRE